MKRLILIFIFLFSAYSHSQEYEFLNKFIKDNIPSMALEQQWAPMVRFDGNRVTETFLREQWEPIRGSNIPDIEPFLEGINIQHLSLFINDRDNVGIEANYLKNKVHLIKDIGNYLKDNDSYCQISKPFISCSKDWAIIFSACRWEKASSGGDWYVYRKIKGMWQFYYRISMYL